MELAANELSAEKLPVSARTGVESSLDSDGRPELLTQELKNMSDDEITEKIETILTERIKAGDDQALFQLGQLYFEQEEYGKAKIYFERSAEKQDLQSKFQLGVIEYDGLAGEPNHKRGFDLMMEVASDTSKKGRHLVRAAQYNLGRAYFQGYGCRQSDEMTEKFWLAAADDGNPKASVKAQTSLGYYYARSESLDKKKAFFWHSEACGNGSLESQGALGVMYLLGQGTKKDDNSAFICLREAAERGNVYAMGQLVGYYYKRKLLTKAVELAARVSMFENPTQIGEETDCLPAFVAKGIAIACFYYARCLAQGMGIKRDEEEAKKYYSKSYYFDGDVCAKLQAATQRGEI